VLARPCPFPLQDSSCTCCLGFSLVDQPLWMS